MLLFWIWFAELPHVSIAQKYQLLQHFSDPEEIYFSEAKAFFDMEGITEKTVKALENKNLDGAHKILKECTLPLTAKGQVNMIVTEMGVMEVTKEGLVLTEYNPEFTVEQIHFTVADLTLSGNITVGDAVCGDVTVRRCIRIYFVRLHRNRFFILVSAKRTFFVNSSVLGTGRLLIASLLYGNINHIVAELCLSGCKFGLTVTYGTELIAVSVIVAIRRYGLIA